MRGHQCQDPRGVGIFLGRRPTSVSVSKFVTVPIQKYVTQLICHGSFLDLGKLEYVFLSFGDDGDLNLWA